MNNAASKDFYLFRHGETPFNAEGRISGRLETPLSEKGVRQADELAENFIKMGISLDVVVSSPQERALWTGERVAESQRIPLIVEDELRETNYGDGEGKLRAELSRHDLEHYLSTAYPNWSFQNGETQLASAMRIMNVLKKFADSDYNVIGISTHGGILRFLMANYFATQTSGLLPNAVPYRITYGAGVWIRAKLPG